MESVDIWLKSGLKIKRSQPQTETLFQTNIEPYSFPEIPLLKGNCLYIALLGAPCFLGAGQETSRTLVPKGFLSQAKLSVESFPIQVPRPFGEHQKK